MVAVMTYNFDPERWYENQRALIEARRVRGELDDEDLEKALEELERRHADMLRRLDGTYRIPEK